MSGSVVETQMTRPEANITSTVASAALIDNLRTAMRRAIAKDANLDPGVLDIVGMSGHIYRRFINNFIRSLPDARYLEIGSWAGSTLCSAINRNAVRATAIDNWSQFGGPKETFLANVGTFRTPMAYVNFLEMDFRQVDYASLGSFNVYLFDGPHEKQDQFDGLNLAMPALDQTFVLVVDDWNWAAVREGTNEAIERCGLVEHYKLEIRTTLDDTHAAVHGKESEWHNGYLVAVLSKPS